MEKPDSDFSGLENRFAVLFGMSEQKLARGLSLDPISDKAAEVFGVHVDQVTPEQRRFTKVKYFNLSEESLKSLTGRFMPGSVG